MSSANCTQFNITITNRICGVMVSMFASNTVDHVFEPRSGQMKDFNIGICCFSAEDMTLSSKSKDRLAQNQDNVSEWCNMSPTTLS
jgi:hypothetical protein